MTSKDNQKQEGEKEPVRQAPEKKEPVIPLARETKSPEEERPTEKEAPVGEPAPPPPTIRREPPPELEPKEVVTVPKPPRPSRPARILRFIKAQVFTKTRVFFQQKVIKPIITRLAKTAVGKAIKEGAKKAGAWVATKLGIQAAVTAAGAATAEISAGVSLLISAAINLAIEVATRVLGKAKDLIKKLFGKPEALIATGAMLGALGFIVTAPISIIFWGAGGILLVTGVAIASPALIAGAQAGISGFFSQVAATPAAFFSALATLTMETIITIITLATIGGLVFATFFQVMTTSSAFILPHEPPEIGEPIRIGEPVSPGDPTDPTLHLAQRVVAILNNCGITFVTKHNLTKVASCINASGLSDFEKRTIINHFNYSANKYSSLQCVGFIRGVMAALGRDPGGGRHALGYLYPPTPPGYEPANTNMSQAQVGDLVIMKVGAYGHIGIVVGREGNYILVAQAWGGSGRVEVTKTNQVYWAGFLRPK